MRPKIVTSTFLAAGLLAFGIRSAAQHPHDHSQDPASQQTTESQPKSGMMGGSMMEQGAGQGQGMMSGGMMAQMKSHHEKMSELMKNLMQSMAAIQTEKDPEALKAKLAEHKALLDQMHSQMVEQGKNMHMMSGQMKQNCMGATDAAKPPAK